MYPDIRNATVQGKAATSLVEKQWINEEFTPRVQQRGAEIIKLRKFSSAASAGSAAIDHMRDWVAGSSEWQSISFLSDGQTYGIPKGLIFSMPVTTKNGKYEVVKGLDVSDEDSQMRLKKTIDELLGERQAVEHLLK